jgi:hypothetical protein
MSSTGAHHERRDAAGVSPKAASLVTPPSAALLASVDAAEGSIQPSASHIPRARCSFTRSHHHTKPYRCRHNIHPSSASFVVACKPSVAPSSYSTLALPTTLRCCPNTRAFHSFLPQPPHADNNNHHHYHSTTTTTRQHPAFGSHLHHATRQSSLPSSSRRRCLI